MNLLTPTRLPVYSSSPVLNNTSASGSPSRKSKAIFSSNGFTPMGGMEQRYKTRKGKAARRLVAVINILPASLNNEAHVSTRSKTMRKSPGTSTPTNTPSVSSPAAQSTPLHTPFSWLHKHVRNDFQGQFLAQTMDVCRGIETCLNLVMEAQLHAANNAGAEPDPDDRPLLSIGDTERLLRLALVSSKMLADEADSRIDRLNNAGKEAK